MIAYTYYVYSIRRSPMFNSNKVNAEELNEEEAKKVNERFNSFKSEEYSEDDMHKVFENEDAILGKMNNKHLIGFIKDVNIFFSMLKDYFRKKYTDVPVGTIMAIVGSLLYVLLPADIIPDFIPIIGYLDDAAVLATCITFVHSDVQKYKEFMGL